MSRPEPARPAGTDDTLGRKPPWSAYADHFTLDKSVVFLNHGSFGATPRQVLIAQDRVRQMMEAEPVRFIVEEREALLDDSRAEMSKFVGCDPEGFAFVSNATAGVNGVVRSLDFSPGDELLTSTHEYNACNNVLRWAVEKFGAVLVNADVPFPIRDEDEIVGAILAKVTSRTKLALISHITSPTAVVMPVERLVRELEPRGVDTLVDGAHAPGHLPLDVARINAAYYTGNFHKWACAPKGSAFLHVREDRRTARGGGWMQPAVISHGANSTRTDRTRFRLEFDYVGSMDYAPWIVAGECVRVMEKIFPGGWPGIMKHNRELALAAARMLRERLGGEGGGAEPGVPESMLGCMATIRIPDRSPAENDIPTRYHDPIQDRLIRDWGVQCPIVTFPAPPARWVRISAQIYNTLAQYEYLAEAIAGSVT
jgi:isopenicillin-N epimerase